MGILLLVMFIIMVLSGITWLVDHGDLKFRHVFPERFPMNGNLALPIQQFLVSMWMKYVEMPRMSIEELDALRKYIDDCQKIASGIDPKDYRGYENLIGKDSHLLRVSCAYYDCCEKVKYRKGRDNFHELRKFQSSSESGRPRSGGSLKSFSSVHARDVSGADRKALKDEMNK